MNKLFKLIISVMLIFFISSDAFSQSLDYPAVYMIKEKDSLESLAKKFLPRYKIKYGKNIEEFKRDIVKWNPQINNWTIIPVFSNIYIEFPYPAYISFPYAQKLTEGTNYNVLNSDAETPIGNRTFTLFTMYTTSVGNFQEEIKTVEGNIKSSQNSPLSLGIGTSIFLDRSSRMMTSSLYWSKLSTSKRNDSDLESEKNIATKAEIGLSLYYQQLTPWASISLFGGVDYEQFSTFNITDFVLGEDLAMNQNKIVFATVGLGKTFFFGDNKLLLKSSFSQSVNSKTTSEYTIDEFSGQRFLLYGSIKGESQFTYHLIYKRHMLDGPTKLTVNRFGLGIGFVIF